MIFSCYAAKPAVYNFFVHTGNACSMKYMTKRKGGFMSMYGQWTKEPQLRPWAARELKKGYDALFLSGPVSAYSSEQMAIIEDYLSRGRTVTYLATYNSLRSPAGKQLMKRFDFEVRLSDESPANRGRRPFNVHGPEEWTESIFRFYVDPGLKGAIVERGLEPVVYLTKGGFHINEKAWKNTHRHFDVLSQKEVGGGRFWLVMPMELFSDAVLRGLYEDADVARQQMAELVIRLGKFSVGDHSQYYVD